MGKTIDCFHLIVKIEQKMFEIIYWNYFWATHKYKLCSQHINIENVTT